MIENRHIEGMWSGVRLDAVLLDAFPSSTRAFVREAIASGQVKVDGRLAAKGLKLKGRHGIEILSLAEAKDNTVLPDASVAVSEVWCDEALLAYDKPGGQSVQPLSRTETGTLMNGVVARHPECAGIGDLPLVAGALHRIDGGTSGLVMVARTADAFEKMRRQFAAHTVEKTYLALVEGRVEEGGTISGFLQHDRRLDYCRMIEGGEMFAETRYEPIAHLREGNEDRTLLKVVIFTGVTHQIRTQLAARKMNIVNDRLYGAFAVEDMQGHCLHSWKARFKHPVSGEELEISAPPPSWAPVP